MKRMENNFRCFQSKTKLRSLEEVMEEHLRRMNSDRLTTQILMYGLRRRRSSDLGQSSSTTLKRSMMYPKLQNGSASQMLPCAGFLKYCAVFECRFPSRYCLGFLLQGQLRHFCYKQPVRSNVIN
jgi:hypothetical protein